MGSERRLFLWQNPHRRVPHEAEDTPEQFCTPEHSVVPGIRQGLNRRINPELEARDIEKTEQEMKQRPREDVLLEKIRSWTSTCSDILFFIGSLYGRWFPKYGKRFEISSLKNFSWVQFTFNQIKQKNVIRLETSNIWIVYNEKKWLEIQSNDIEIDLAKLSYFGLLWMRIK